MITFNESPKSPSLLQRLVGGLAQGGMQYAKLREDRRNEELDDQETRLRNMLAMGGGEIGEPDARFLASKGLESRLSPIEGAIAGERRFRINPTPQQLQQEAAAKRSMQLTEMADEDERKSHIVGQWLSQNNINPIDDPIAAAKAYYAAGIKKLPEFIKDLLDNQQALTRTEMMFDQQTRIRQMINAALAERQQQSIQSRLNPQSFKKQLTPGEQ